MDRRLTFVRMEGATGITDAELARVTEACASDPFAPGTEYGDACRRGPVRFSRDDLDLMSDTGDVRVAGACAWPVADRHEALAVRADLTRLAGDDDEWLPFGQQGVDHLEGRHADDTCVAIGATTGAAMGYLLTSRSASLGGTADAPEIWCTYVLERAYLVPDARGTGLSAAFAAIACDLLASDMRALDEAFGDRGTPARVTVQVTGEGESVPGARLMTGIAGRMRSTLENLPGAPGNLALRPMVVDLYTAIVDLMDERKGPST